MSTADTDEHRLNPNLFDSIQSALRRLQSEPSEPSSVLITTAQSKFFNGYDLELNCNPLSPDPLQAKTPSN
ncbi:hypothetical protein LINPERHAP2_LOCUS37418 [Linum perenne]